MEKDDSTNNLCTVKKLKAFILVFYLNSTNAATIEPNFSPDRSSIKR